MPTRKMPRRDESIPRITVTPHPEGNRPLSRMAVAKAGNMPSAPARQAWLPAMNGPRAKTQRREGVFHQTRSQYPDRTSRPGNPLPGAPLRFRLRFVATLRLRLGAGSGLPSAVLFGFLQLQYAKAIASIHYTCVKGADAANGIRGYDATIIKWVNLVCDKTKSKEESYAEIDQ